MKTVFAVVGGIAAVIVLLVASFIGYAVYAEGRLVKSGRAYIEANVPPILSTWSDGALLEKSSPQLLRAVAEANGPTLHQIFSRLSALGPLRTLANLKGTAQIGYFSGAGKTVTADYNADADFENGKATLKIRLIQIDGQWRFLGFYVDKPRDVRTTAHRQT